MHRWRTRVIVLRQLCEPRQLLKHHGEISPPGTPARGIDCPVSLPAFDSRIASFLPIRRRSGRCSNFPACRVLAAGVGKGMFVSPWTGQHPEHTVAMPAERPLCRRILTRLAGAGSLAPEDDGCAAVEQTRYCSTFGLSLTQSQRCHWQFKISNHIFFWLLCVKQEAQLWQRDRATRYVSKFMLCFTRHGSYNLQTFQRALAELHFQLQHLCLRYGIFTCAQTLTRWAA